MINTFEVKGVVKKFKGTIALQNAYLKLEGGRVQCLVGANGAGKSTIIKIIAGYYQPDQGHLLIDNKPVVFNNPRDSKNHGVSIIHQELLLVPHLTVAENMLLGEWPKSTNRLIDWKDITKKAKEALDMLGTNISPNTLVKHLSTGEQQLVEIARALTRETKVLILDEPTASLSEGETQQLLTIIRSLRDKGMAIMYVSHRLDEVFDIGDDITVFRDGQYVGSAEKKDLTQDEVVRMMVGRDVSLERKRVGEIGEEVLQVKGIKLHSKLKDVSFNLHKGEILGLAGLVGSGRTETLNCLFGIDQPKEGDIYLNGQKVQIKAPGDAIKLGIGMVPEDRKVAGLNLTGSVKENASISIIRKLSKWSLINQSKESELVEQYKKELRIKTPDIDTPVSSLSGGNQQKVILARWLATHPKILLLDEPTRGVDVGARTEIQEMIESLVTKGMSIIMVSSDIAELLAMSDRVIVYREGKTVAELKGNGVTKEEVLKYAT
ncbi:sugar ABC transporter ATP-binding protein [Peribacillus frigoritolerans]|uniref:sugar ABC transporter ATP-binding protein n=1 Tax=Peribacillus frigoritolerans TaxID=450367 RepID=UPI00241704EF|nr:sugar ABC transporter ATP-binding protein [Peribacillus frigoritolerans]MDG4850343.1 sugar ABC transporter ATP-binding protein [Peribacillus frigoritolerans]